MQLPKQEQDPEQSKTKGLLSLPDEILLQILSCWSTKPGVLERSTANLITADQIHCITGLEPRETTSLQTTCKDLLAICRDNKLWRARCFEESTFLHNLRRREVLLRRWNDYQPDASENDSLTRAVPTSSACELAESRTNERKRIMANWDPSYEGENVNWYEEYIQRHANTSVNWLRQPVLRDGAESTFIEARGLALYRPDNPDQPPKGLETILAVAPLDDGSVCLWDVTGAKGKKGAIFARSRPGILYIDGSNANTKRRTKRMDSNVTECVSVDSKLHLAFFANESRKSIHVCLVVMSSEC